LGEGDIAVGAVRAFQAGVLDVPFAPSRFNAGKILPARDNEGAVRLLDIAALPFTDELKAFHREKMAERARFEKRPVSFQMVIDDIYAIRREPRDARKKQGSVLTMKIVILCARRAAGFFLRRPARHQARREGRRRGVLENPCAGFPRRGTGGEAIP
jgi:hypothetical protein